MVLVKKICLIGDFAVGKTSLIRQYVEGQFSDKYLSTVGVKISRKSLEIADSKGAPPTQFKLVIWDLEGHTKFEALAPSYLRGASGAIVVGALDRQPTLESLEQHIQQFLMVNPAQPVIVALNKADLISAEQQQILLDRCHSIVTSEIVDYQLTSAKTGENVNSLFEKLAKSFPIAPKGDGKPT